jgi:hypothetical protein
MPKRPDESPDQTGEKLKVNTARLETLAHAVSGMAQAKRWQARKSGLQDSEEASEVRNLNHDAEARAQAEAAMKQMMAKTAKKHRHR